MKHKHIRSVVKDMDDEVDEDFSQQPSTVNYSASRNQLPHPEEHEDEFLQLPRQPPTTTQQTQISTTNHISSVVSEVDVNGSTIISTSRNLHLQN